MVIGDSGAKMQPEFDKNISQSTIVNYDNPPTSGQIQDILRQKDIDKKSE
jgi:hypothetical protein